MAVNNLRDLLIEELKDVYHAEKQITKAMPKMIKTANSDVLREALEEHLETTNKQITRIEDIFQELDTPAKAKKCVAMEGLIEEGKEHMEEIEDPDTRDAAIIASAQKIEHYEISAYGTLRAHAKLLGLDDIVDTLQETIDEEAEADEKLSQIAESEINVNAMKEGETEEEEAEEE